MTNDPFSNPYNYFIKGSGQVTPRKTWKEQGRVDTRRRKGDRHVNRPRKSRLDLRNIVAWDGEGANLENGTHVYNLLANSKGDSIINHKGLSTVKCLDFFLESDDRTAINVIFAGGYDANMLLRDLTEAQLRQLWDTGSTLYKDYKIRYVPRKMFGVSRGYYDEDTWIAEKSFVLWDVFGFFQTSFVRACEKWLANGLALDDIQRMKYARNTFVAKDIDKIREYNRKELVLLVMLIDAVFDALKEADIELSRFDGAGAIASALLKKHSVHEHKGDYDVVLGGRVYRASQVAYSGGRIEAPRVGNYEGTSYRADIVSAYPSACLQLPSYAGATWQDEETWSGSPSSLVEVEWHYSDPSPFYPLWYRTNVGDIIYPRHGHGVYYGAEVENLRLFYREGRDYQIIRAINPTIVSNAKPFAWLQDVFDIRRRFKERGSMAHEVLKLGINSVYGKLAQQAGYNERRGRDSIPSNHHLLWAGEITARVRATLYRAAKSVEDDVVAFATDAIIATARPPVEEGKNLGQWEVDTFGGITIVQPGVYWLKEEDGTWASKYRGFDPGSLDREKVIEHWRTGETYLASLTRFVGMGSALARTNGVKTLWRTWHREERALNLLPSNKRYPLEGHTNYSEQLEPTGVAENDTPEVMSKEFAIEWLHNRSYMDMDKIEQREYEDSYE